MLRADSSATLEQVQSWMTATLDQVWFSLWWKGGERRGGEGWNGGERRGGEGWNGEEGKGGDRRGGGKGRGDEGTRGEGRERSGKWSTYGEVRDKGEKRWALVAAIVFVQFGSP